MGNICETKQWNQTVFLFTVFWLFFWQFPLIAAGGDDFVIGVSECHAAVRLGGCQLLSAALLLEASVDIEPKSIVQQGPSHAEFKNGDSDMLHKGQMGSTRHFFSYF